MKENEIKSLGFKIDLVSSSVRNENKKINRINYKKSEDIHDMSKKFLNSDILSQREPSPNLYQLQNKRIKMNFLGNTIIIFSIILDYLENFEN